MVVLHGPGGWNVHPRVDCQTIEGLVMQLKACCLRSHISPTKATPRVSSYSLVVGTYVGQHVYANCVFTVLSSTTIVAVGSHAVVYPYGQLEAG